MKRSRHLILATVVTGLPLFGWAYPWDKDMVDQPSEKPQESVAPPGPGSIPVEGGETVPLPLTEEQSLDMKDAAAAIGNPVPVTDESIARGKYFYEINCLVCHGAQGRGDGPVGRKFVEKAPVDLNDVYTQDQADGQLFFTLTRGRALMPFYRDALSPSERWDVINYVKSNFGEK
ncbi:MAG: cytochrome c [Woeseia sp.]